MTNERYMKNHPTCETCRFWVNKSYGCGECNNPIIEIEIEGDAYVKSTETFNYQYCSNYKDKE